MTASAIVNYQSEVIKRMKELRLFFCGHIFCKTIPKTIIFINPEKVFFLFRNLCSLYSVFICLWAPFFEENMNEPFRLEITLNLTHEVLYDNFNFSVLDRFSSNEFGLRILEGIYIKKEKPLLNNQDTCVPLYVTL